MSSVEPDDNLAELVPHLQAQLPNPAFPPMILVISSLERGSFPLITVTSLIENVLFIMLLFKIIDLFFPLIYTDRDSTALI